MRIGFHVSISGGLPKSVERASELGLSAMQVFSRNPRSWAVRVVNPKDIRLFREERARRGIRPVAVHTSYLINLSSPDDGAFMRSVGLFKRELGSAESMGADFLVTHMGSPAGKGPGFAEERVIEAVSEVSREGLGRKTMILFENTAGGGDSFGSSLSEVGRVIRRAGEAGVEAGLCLDTCHAFAAGYPLRDASEVRSFVKELKAEVGLGRLKLIHLNDSKGELGSRLDRHEHIGKGRIGRKGMEAIINCPGFRRVPFILETPRKGVSDDRRNLRTVRRLRRDP